MITACTVTTSVWCAVRYGNNSLQSTDLTNIPTTTYGRMCMTDHAVIARKNCHASSARTAVLNVKRQGKPILTWLKWLQHDRKEQIHGFLCEARRVPRLKFGRGWMRIKEKNIWRSGKIYYFLFPWFFIYCLMTVSLLSLTVQIK